MLKNFTTKVCAHVIKSSVFKAYASVNEKLWIYFIYSAKTILKGNANLASKLVSSKYTTETDEQNTYCNLLFYFCRFTWVISPLSNQSVFLNLILNFAST